MRGLHLLTLLSTVILNTCFAYSNPTIDIWGHNPGAIMSYEKFSDSTTPQDVKSNIEKIPGLHITELGGPGQMTRVSFRGMNSRHTLFKIDGIPLRDASDSVDASSLFSNTLEIANVTPGSGGVFEGSGSTGGTVEMRTPFSKEHPHKTTGMGGSHDTGYVHTMHGMHNDHTSSVIHVDGFNTKGIRQKGPQRIYGERAHAQKGSVAAALAHQRGPQQFSLTLRHIAARSKYDTNGPAGPFSPKPQGTCSQGLTLLGAKISQQELKTHHQLQTFLTQNKLKSSHSPSSELKNYGAYYRADHHLTQKTSITGLAGVDFDTLQKDAFKREDIVKSHAGFLCQYHITSALSVHGGLRHNHHQKFGQITTYSIGTEWAEETKGVALGMRTGYLNPSLYDLHVSDQYTRANPHLRPEESQTFDIMLWKKINDNSELKIKPFWTRVKKMIQSTSVSGGQFQNQNIPGASHVSGVETIFTITPSKKWFHEASYGYTNFDLKSPHTNTEFPKHKIALTSGFKPNDKLSLQGELTFIGQRRSQGHTLKAHTKANLSAEYKLNKQAKLFGRIDNLFDARYTESYFFQTPGQSFYVGTQIYY